MKVPRKAEERAEDFTAFAIAFFDGFRNVRRMFKGR
jgi:hypothetical protein